MPVKPGQRDHLIRLRPEGKLLRVLEQLQRDLEMLKRADRTAGQKKE
ncbi:MAG: hypothetical protein WBD55_10915 [Dehalococcoidia bacterium]